MLIVAIAFLAIMASPAGAGKKAKQPKVKAVARLVFGKYPDLKAVKDVSLAEQNAVADEYRLPRFRDEGDLSLYESEKYLVRVPAKIGCFNVAKRLDVNFRYLASGALQYMQEFAERYCSACGKPPKNCGFTVSSLVRTEKYQRFLAFRKGNPNARQALCDTQEQCSPHVTGFAFDISIKGRRPEDIIRLAGALREDEMNGLLAKVIFEPNQNNFHVMVMPGRTCGK